MELNEQYIFKQELAADGSFSGVEMEDEAIIKPFNPDAISIRTETVPMEKLIRFIRQNKIDMAPDFQRDQVWTITQKSKLIESLILSIPLPMFYVAADAKENWVVVDGLQRFTTIRNFILGKDDAKYSEATYPYKGDGFKLKNMEFFEMYNGYFFRDLPEEIQGRILDSQFNVTVIQNGTPEEVKFNIFKRINTGGVPLSPQEIRHALYQGKSTEFLKRLSKSIYFLEAIDESIDPSRMADRELILRMLSFIIRGVDSFKAQHSMDTFLNETMVILNNLDDQDIEKIEYVFYIGMTRAKELFGSGAFRKSTFEDFSKTPINKSIFDSLGYLLATIDDETFHTICSHSDYFKFTLRDTVYAEQYFGRDSSKFIGVKMRFAFLEALVTVCMGHELTNQQLIDFGEILRANEGKL